MKVIIFGATGMVGQGVLRECLLEPSITNVLVIGRSSIGKTDPKLREIIHKDLTNYGPIENDLAGYDACFFCLGITSAGMTEADYKRVTYDIAVAAATTLKKTSPNLTFVFVSGGGTDSTEQGKTMWARVKGATENAIFKIGFKNAYAFRPAAIQPLHGIRSKTASYNVLYAILWPLFPIVKFFFPKYVTTTETVGRAMIEVAKHGSSKMILENGDINDVVANKSHGT